MKDKLIRKLLDTGKKHRILIYPTLALVAVISAISHTVYWGRGNGKKLVASVMVMTMLITQSMFLTSSADMGDGPADGYVLATGTDAVPDGASDDMSDVLSDNMSDMYIDDLAILGADSAQTLGTVAYLYRIDENDAGHKLDAYPLAVDATTSTVNIPSALDISGYLFGTDQTQHVDISDVYTDVTMQNVATGDVSALTPEGGEYKLYFKATRNSYPLYITNEKTPDNSFSTTADVTVPEAGNIYPACSYPITDGMLYEYGYTFSGATYNGHTYSTGSSLEINTSDDEPKVEVNAIMAIADWDKMKNISVTYVAKPIGAPDAIEVDADTTSSPTGELAVGYTYDEDVTMVSSDNIWAYNDAYELSGWKEVTGTNPGTVYPAGHTINSALLTDPDTSNPQADPNVIGRTYEAQWSYKNIMLNAKSLDNDTSTVTVDNATGNITIESTYGDYINCNITAVYKDGTTGSKFTYAQPDISALNGYGLMIAQGADGSYNLMGKLANVTPETGISFQVVVTDNNVNDGDASKTSTHTVTIISHKRPIQIDASSVTDLNGNKPSKVYNADASIPLPAEAQTVNVIGTVNGDVVRVSLASSALLDYPDAGDRNLTVTVTGLLGDGSLGSSSMVDRYVLVNADGTPVAVPDGKITISNGASVERQPISVDIMLKEGQPSSVRFGEKTPEYTLRVAEGSVSKLVGPASSYSSITTESGYINYMEEILGFKSLNTGRSRYSPVGTYTVDATFSPEGKNYIVTVATKPTFTVTRDAGVRFTGDNADIANYKFSTTPINGFYPGLTITADGINYDQIRLVAAGEGDITADMTDAQVAQLFAQNPSVELGDLENANVTIQMRNSTTGAITTLTTESGINVDKTGPVLKGYVVSPEIKYFNEFSFGSYFHSQLIEGIEVSSINIKVQFEASGSEANNLYYYFVDEYGSKIDANVIEKDLTFNPTTGFYEATILIGSTNYGQLVVSADDLAGNVSVESTIKIADQKEIIDEYVKDESGKSYFEWMIENNIDGSSVITTTTLSGDAASVSSEGTKVWYNGLNFETIATENDDTENGIFNSGVNRIEWTITRPDGTTFEVTENAGDVVSSVLDIEEYGKIRSYIFKYVLQGEHLQNGEYKVSAVIYDNAGNSMELAQVGPYLIDCVAPVITDNTQIGTETYLSDVVFEFTVSDGSDGSGVQTVTLYKQDGTELTELEVWGVLDSYSYDITSNGTYVVKAVDTAGNVTTYDRVFTGISDMPPEAPVISVEGTEGRNGWYLSKPDIIITSTTDIDGVPVGTKYSVEVGSDYVQDSFTSDYHKFQLEQTGIVTVSAWAVSAAGISSVETCEKEVKVDLDAPEVTVVESVVDADGNLVVSFKVTDATSGIDSSRIYLNGEPVSVSVTDGVATGSFTAMDGMTYVLTAEDNAGNVSEELEFATLAVKALPITNITTSGAYLEVEIYEGTYPVSECYIAYKEATDTTYIRTLSNKKDTDYGKNLNCTFRELSADTVYDYKIYVKTDVSGEVKVVEGRFRTASSTATAVVYGTAVYDTTYDNIIDEYPIFVSLYEANTIIASEKLTDATTTSYVFKNIPDGSYRVVATDGYYTKTASVTIENGGIVYPTDYSANDGINFVLNGKSTSVVIEDNAINITADELESIYDNSLYEGIITPEDEEVLANGGTINVELHASYMDASDVSAEEQSVFDAKISKDAIIEKYIQLFVVKEVKDVNGNYVNGTPELIPELYYPITISFPLGELAGEEIYVASVHDNGSDYLFKDWKNAEDVILSRNYVTITTRFFSVYALYRIEETPVYYTVKWVDGDGKIMKTEQVESGKSATPPTQTPTKTPSAKYTYKFSQWDKDYTNITADTVISAWFTAHAIEDNKDETPDDNKEPEQKPDDSNKPGTTPDDNKEPVKDPDKDPGKDATVTPPSQPTTQQPQYGYMGSADSPRTGDGTPIILLMFIMMMSVGGMVVLKKKADK